MKDKKFRPKGPYAALLTPYNKDMTINEYELKRQLKFLGSSNISGVFPCGSSGEFVHLSTEENIKITEIVSKSLAGQKEVIPGACSSNIDRTIMFMENAKRLNCKAVVICPPYYYKLNQREIVHFYKTIARACDIKIILYNIPMFTNEITINSVQELMSEPNIIGIKDSSGNMKKIIHYIRISREHRPRFAVMTGSDDIIYPAIISGCVGSMTALSGIIPEINIGIYDAYYECDYERAKELQYSSLKLLSLAETISFPAGYKIIAEKRGMKMGPIRQTIPEKDTDEYYKLSIAIEKELHKILGDFISI